MNQKMNFAQMSHALVFLSLILCLGCLTARAQTTVFTYQGRLNDSQTMNGTGSYLMEFRLFAAASGGTPIQTLTDVPVSVVNNVFTVQLNFTANNSFDGADRFLEIAVKRTAGETYTTLSPRQPFTAAPYSIKAKNATLADTSTNTLNVGGTPAANIIKEADPRLTDPRTPSAGSANYVQNATTEQTLTDFNISGGGTANIFNARTQFNIGGVRVLTANGSSISAGVGSGNAVSNNANTFFGGVTGSVTTGSANSFFGNSAGRGNTTGSDNSFFGSIAGLFNTAGMRNTFVGSAAGYRNQAGNDNTFIGNQAGTISAPGNFNTFVGAQSGADVSNLQYAAAIGAGATVSDSNSVVLGRTLDTVRIPGTLNVNTFTAATFSANTLNAATQFNLGGNRILSSGGTENLFVGVNAGRVNASGQNNAFFGENAGYSNTTGSNNSFIGFYAGYSNSTGGDNTFVGREGGFSNTTGGGNSFFGVQAGYSNTGGIGNSFIGLNAGYSNTTGGNNSFVGRDVGFLNTTGEFNSFIGAGAGLSNTTGSNNTVVGNSANVGAGNLTFATAIGAGALVGSSNSVVLGRTADTVRIPGTLNVNTFTASALSANAVNADTQFNLGGNRILSASGAGTLSVGVSTGIGGTANAFFGTQAGNLNTGSENAFFGILAGFSNLTGRENSFFGRVAGGDNTTGIGNSFFGSRAGRRNTIGGSNAFFGAFAGDANISGSNNTIIGNNADVGSDALTFATAIGAGAVVSDNNTVVLGRTADTVIAPNLLQVNVLGVLGDTSLCRNSLNQISICTAGNLTEQSKDAARLDALQMQNAQMLEQLKQQQILIGELKKLVCANNPTAAVCQ